MVYEVDKSANFESDEHIIYSQNPNFSSPFSVVLAGETFPESRYHISHWPNDTYVFEYVLSGKGILEVNKMTYQISAGDFYMISDITRCDYYAHPSTPYHKIWINCVGGLNRSLCQAFGLNAPFLIFPFPEAEQYIRDMHQALSDPTAERTTAEANCAALLLKLLMRLSGKMNRSVGKSKKFVPNTIHDYLIKHALEPVSLEDLEKHFSISRTHINRIFKNEYGMSPYHFLIEQRISLACSMLRKSDLTIAEIADQLLFADAHYFSNVFKKSIGCSPRQYRNSLPQAGQTDTKDLL